MTDSYALFATIAFFGGALSLFSPCSGALLPAYFASTFNSKQKLLLGTFIFFLGLATITIPIGIGFAFLLGLLTNFGVILYRSLGVVMILIGISVMAGRGRSSIKSILWRPKNTYLAIYSLGLFSGLAAGTCSGPIIGSIATLASISGSYYKAGILMAFYSLGMVAPLFLASIFLERFSILQMVFSRERLGAYFSGSVLILSGLTFYFWLGSINRYLALLGSGWFVRVLDLQDKLLLLLY